MTNEVSLADKAIIVDNADGTTKADDMTGTANELNELDEANGAGMANEAVTSNKANETDTVDEAIVTVASDRTNLADKATAF